MILRASILVVPAALALSAPHAEGGVPSSRAGGPAVEDGIPSSRAGGPAVEDGVPQEVQQTIRINAGGGDGGPISVLPPGRAPKVGTSRMRGRVLSGDTGNPVRRAQVRVSGPDIGTKSTLTDAQGRYEFKDLPAGRFNVSVDDLRATALPALRHRLILNFEGEAEGIDVDDLIGQIVEHAESLSGSGKEVFLR